MLRKFVDCYILILLLLACTASAQTIQMRPFTIDWRDNKDSLVNLSFLLDAPAGKAGFVRAADGHLVRPNGERFRIWGVNFTGASCFPSKQDAPVVADHLARFGINCVRFHFLDSNWSASLFVKGRDDTRAFDPQQLDRLDYFIAELKKRGIYTNLNLNVGRNYRKGDGVKDYEYLGLAKVVNFFDEHIQMLHKEYARQLLTHYNPYTKAQYRNEPAILIVEILNENSIVEAWFSDRLLGRNTKKHPGTWSDITAWYENQLTRKYNAWLKVHLTPAELEKMRAIAGVKEAEPIPRLTKNRFAKASQERFRREAEFYMELQDTFFQSMYNYLKKDLGVNSLIAGTSDHNHWKTGYPLLAATSKLDVVDGHVYWQHPRYFTDSKTKRRTFSIPNSPMVNDPLNSTVVQLSRSAVAAKPYTISETNHPFPNEYACEGIGILAAYSSFHDWDGIFFYTFEHKDPEEWGKRIPRHFDIRPDPVRMANLAAGAIMFLRRDVRPSRTTIDRAYSIEQIYDGIRAPSSEHPYFTPGFSLSIPLRHTTRIVSFDDQPRRYGQISAESPIVSDTRELAWHYPPQAKGLVTVQTDKSQALIGFVGGNDKPLKNLSAQVENDFCAIILTSLDGKAIFGSEKLLLTATARSANTAMKWNDTKTSLVDWGSAPTVIEPVKGHVTLVNLRPHKKFEVIALDGAGKSLAQSIETRTSPKGIEIAVGEPATTWYLINVTR
ncbi:MAG: glycoside hydrolase family 5 protein [Planctomycetota bacterium]